MHVSTQVSCHVQLVKSVFFAAGNQELGEGGLVLFHPDVASTRIKIESAAHVTSHVLGSQTETVVFQMSFGGSHVFHAHIQEFLDGCLVDFAIPVRAAEEFDNDFVEGNGLFFKAAGHAGDGSIHIFAGLGPCLYPSFWHNSVKRPNKMAWCMVKSGTLAQNQGLYILQQAEILPKELPEGENPNKTTLKGGEINGED